MGLSGFKDLENDWRCREIETLLRQRGVELPHFWSAAGRRKYLREMEVFHRLEGVSPPPLRRIR